MIEILRLSPSNQRNKHYYSQILKYFDKKFIVSGMNILDIGDRSPLTEMIEQRYKANIINTVGDLDGLYLYETCADGFHAVIYSHTIEHQFNPLVTLWGINQMEHKAKGFVLYIILPSRPKFLWSKQHFHEIDNYRMRLLLERAGIEIVSYERRKHWRPIKEYFGFRAFLRLFFEYNAYYECKIKEI